MRAGFIATLGTALPLLAAAAQNNSIYMSDVHLDWMRNRRNVLAYVDAIPDSSLAFRPTPGVRTLGEQFGHIASTNLAVAARALKGATDVPKLGDSTEYLHNKAALRAYVAASYDYVIKALIEAKPADLNKQSVMFGQQAQPARRWLQLSLEHSVWTLGQVVPYLRLNRAGPPSYSLPF
jgi:hypothetical protein